jgi:hypothetical protein
MNDDVLMDANVMSLSGNVLGELDFGSWSSDGGKLGSHFSLMDDEYLEDDLDYFAVLDLAAFMDHQEIRVVKNMLTEMS